MLQEVYERAKRSQQWCFFWVGILSAPSLAEFDTTHADLTDFTTR